MMWRLSSIDARKNIHIQHFTQKGQRMIMKTRNEVHLTGGIVRIRASKSVTLLTIATTVAGVATAFPTIVFYEPKKTKGFEIGDRVTVDAHIQLHIGRDENGKTTNYSQDIVGDKICKAQRMLAPFITDETVSKTEGGVRSDENYAYIFGRVRHVYNAPNGVVILSVSVPREDNRFDSCEIACFRRQAEVARMLEEGDCVMVGGVVQTRNGKTKDDRTAQNVACRDIVKCEGFEDLPH